MKITNRNCFFAVAGPWFATAATPQIRHAPAPNLPATRDQRTTLPGAAHDVGAQRVFGQHTRINNDRLAIRDKLAHIGITAPVGDLGQLQRGTGQDKTGGSTVAKRTTTTLGCVHALSKRTQLDGFVMRDEVPVGIAENDVVGVRHMF